MTDYTNLRKIVTGDIIIKCRYKNEIRRIPINQVPTYDELCLMMYRVFKTEFSTPENIALKYMDNEGDMISLLDDIDITHAISISSLLKVFVYDKSASTAQHQQPSSELQASLIEIRDTLNDLIKSCKKADINEKGNVVTTNGTEKEESKKATRRLTPAELAEFLNDTSKTNNNKDTGEKASVKELATLSPEMPSNIPYYPPPQPQIQQPQPQQVQPQQQQQQQQQPIHHQYPPPVGVPQQQQQHLRPVSMQPQQQRPPQTPQNNPQLSPYPPPPLPTSQQQQFAPNYPPPPQANINNDPRLQQQQQQQQQQQPPPRQQQGYYVPPPPATMNATPQLPPQPYNPSARW